MEVEALRLREVGLRDLWMEVLMSGQPGRFLVGIGEGAELLLGGLAVQFKLQASRRAVS
jgi:hypothetical protein